MTLFEMPMIHIRKTRRYKEDAIGMNMLQIAATRTDKPRIRTECCGQMSFKMPPMMEPMNEPAPRAARPRDISS